MRHPPNTNYPLSAGSSTSQGGSFSQPSFSVGTSGSALIGGQNQGLNPGTIYSYDLSYGPDGDVLAANDSANGNWSYAYDDFNRLASAVNSGQGWTYTNGYDRFGNRWYQYLNGACTAGTSFCLTFDANNRVNNGALQYDADGNVTQDSAHHYYYDDENRLIQVDGTLGTCSTATACYVYDAEGRRVQKTVAGATVGYVYDVAGHQVAEVNSSGGVNRAEVYAAGMHLATYANGLSGTTYFDHGDWLGTERVRSAMDASVCETTTSLPFGDGMALSGACSDVSPMHFTGKERDPESNLDNFGARYDSSSLGRFMSPDPLGGHTEDPQTLNKYSYVRNNPLSLTDPTGLDFNLNCDKNNGTTCKAAMSTTRIRMASIERL